MGRLSLAWHPARLILLGAGCAALATGLLAVSQEPAVAVVAAVLLGLAWPAMHSSLQTWATEVLPGARAVVVSLFAASLFVGSAVGAIAVADLADAGRFALVYARVRRARRAARRSAPGRPGTLARDRSRTSEP